MTDLLLKTDQHRLKMYIKNKDEYPTGRYFETPVFRMHNLMNLYANIYPNGYNSHYEGHTSVYIILDKMPVYFKKIRFRYQLKFEKNEISKTYSNTGEWRSDGSSVYNDRFCSSKEFCGDHYGWSYIEFKMQILALYDDKEQEIGVEEHKAIETGQLVQMQEKIKSIESKLNELSKLMQEIDNMKKDVELLKQNNKVLTNDESGIKQWLSDKVKLPQYYDVFIANGIDNLDVAKLITMDVLKEIGVKMIGHRMRILHSVENLN